MQTKRTIKNSLAPRQSTRQRIGARGAGADMMRCVECQRGADMVSSHFTILDSFVHAPF